MKVKYPDATIKLIKGSGGVFDVKCDGKVIYSKQKIQGQRFPDEGEIAAIIEEKKG